MLRLEVRWRAEPGGPVHETAFGGPADGTPQGLPAFDGAPVGTPDAITLSRVDASSLDSTALAHGAVIASAPRLATRDGTLLAVVQEHTDPAGRRTRNFQLHRRL